MEFELAPMEAVTTYIYRTAYRQFFEPMDCYYTPFLSPNQNRLLSHKDLQEVLPEHNRDMFLVPQILTKDARLFVGLARELKQMGYQEVNINLGCPSATVVTKGKGAGALKDLVQLENDLDEIFQGLPDMKISVKTRIGIENPEEFWAILPIYNKFPIYKLIVHPRVQQEFYRGEPHMELLHQISNLTDLRISYNGDLFTVNRIREFEKSYPQIQSIMIGRGVIADPSMVGFLKQGKPLTKELLRAFHDLILTDYLEISSGDRNALFKMKELWFYMNTLFQSPDAYFKKIKKAGKMAEYQTAVNQLFQEQELVLRY